MADSTLRMKIVTALDNAGLKATDQQLNSLEKSISKVNTVGTAASGNMGRQVNDLSKLVGGGAGNWLRYVVNVQKVTSAAPGVMGGLRGIGAAIKGVWTSLGPIGWAVLAIMGLKKAWDMVSAAFSKISNFGLLRLPEMLKEKWDAAVNYIKGIPARIKDTWDELWTGTSKGKEAKQAFDDTNKALEEHSKVLEKTTQKKLELMKKEEDEHQKVIDAIKRETQAYISQAQTLQGLKSAKGDAELLWLNAQKFKEQQAYEAAGQYEAAEQIGLAYDVEIQRTKLRHEIAEAQLNQRQAMRQATAAERDANAKTSMADKREENLRKLYAQKEQIQYKYHNPTDWSQGNERVTQEQRQAIAKKRREAYVKDLTAINAAIKAEEKKYYKDVQEEWTAHEDLWNKYGKVTELQQRESNIRMGGETALNMARWNYDKFLDQNGNMANIVFDKDYIEKMNGEYASEEYFKEIAANTDAMAEKLDYLLQMKEQ